MGTVLPGRQRTFASIFFKDDVPLVIAAETRTQSHNLNGLGLGRLGHLGHLGHPDHLDQMDMGHPGHLTLGHLGLGHLGDPVALGLDLDQSGRQVGGLEVPWVLP